MCSHAECHEDGKNDSKDLETHDGQNISLGIRLL
jgi:hypothetical protein